jgi:4-hydroxybenzoate polyprenyltransferase
MGDLATRAALDDTLYVDLEHALARTDLVAESVLSALRAHPMSALSLPVWILRGRARFRQEVIRRADLDPDLLSYREPVLEYLRKEHSGSRPLVLVSALGERLADEVARRVGLFADVMALPPESGAGTSSLDVLRERVNGRFAHAGRGGEIPGTDKGDVIVVRAGGGSVGETSDEIEAVFPSDQDTSLRVHLRAMRLHQWLKNLLVFAPPVMAHRLADVSVMMSAAIGFVAFSFCATSAYLLNDLLDLPADRQHRTKRARPFASGELSIGRGMALIPLFLLSAFALATLLPLRFAGILTLYFMSTLAYSWRLKRAALIDVLVLAGLYTLRILGGGAATTTPVSFWLLAFSMFLFLSLGLVKRYAELSGLAELGTDRAAGRGYQAVDLETLAQFGSASGYMSVLVLALYINSDAVQALYSSPETIWLLCPLLLYLLSRVWLLARRGAVHEDPVVFLLEDRRSQVLLMIGAALLWVAV